MTLGVLGLKFTLRASYKKVARGRTEDLNKNKELMVKGLLHNPVLVSEVVEAMALEDGKVIVDGTLGLGGYSQAALQTGKKIKIMAFDLDEQNMRLARQRLADYGDAVAYYRNNFAEMGEVLQADKVEQVDGVMLDLGIASTQVDNADRGFSFIKDGDLDMRFDSRQTLSAKDIVNTYSLDQLTRIFRELGEERQARRAATAIVTRRKEKLFERTLELVQFLEGVISSKKSRIHPATKIFQALRIEVNKELSNLQKVLQDSLAMLSVSGRIAVVSYHSLEDRIVKNFFRAQSKEYINLPNQLTTTYLEPKLKILTKKPIVPTVRELSENPRSRSAKLRVAERI